MILLGTGLAYFKGAGVGSRQLEGPELPGGEATASRTPAHSLESGVRKELSRQSVVPSSGPEGKLILEVTSLDGTAIGGASLTNVVNGTEEHAIGKTDASGNLTLEHPLGAGRLVVRGQGFATFEETHYGLELGEHHVVQLSPEATIRGRVVSREDGSPLEGALVWAMPQDAVNEFTFIDPDRAQLLSRVSDTSLCGRTDSDGRFVIGRLSAEDTYDVSAILPGLRNVDARVGSRPTKAPIELTMAQCWGMFVKVEAPDGRTVDLMPSGVVREERWVDPMGAYFDQSADFEIPLDVELLEAWGETRHRDHSTAFTILSYSRGGERQLGNLVVSLDWPGFVPSVTVLPLEFIDDKLPIHTIRLEPGPGGVARPSFQFTGLPAGVETIDPEQAAGALHLHSSAGDDTFFAVTFAEVIGGVSLPGVRAGYYELHFVNANEVCSVPERGFVGVGDGRGSRLVSLSPGESSIDFDMAEMSLLRIAMYDPEGAPYTGLLNFELSRRVVVEGGVNETMGRGTLISKWRRVGEYAGVLLTEGAFRLEPVPLVVSVEPEIQVGGDWRFVEPLILSIGRGETRTVEWMALDPSLIEK